MNPGFKPNTHLKSIYRFILWFNGVFLVTAFGIFVSMPEYSGTGGTEHYTGLYRGFRLYLNKILTFQLSTIAAIALGLALISFVVWVLLYYSDRTEKLLNRITELESERLQLSAHITSLAYANTNRNEKDKIVDIMETFLSNYNDIISIQLYEYNEAKISRNIHYEIKPTPYYYTSSASVANLVHEKYIIPERLLIQYKKVREMYKEGHYDILEKYIKSLIEQLKKKEQTRHITEDAINKYVLLTLALQLDFDELSFKISELNPEFQDTLNRAKRTGFLRGIIESNYYKFCHLGDSMKGRRIYITKCFSLESKPHMFVIVLHPDVINREDYSDYIDYIGEKFYDILSKELNIVYNKCK
ncbi:MAG: hypothetical protein ACM3TR_07285 [Caulobacteraceae bacterium]